MSFLKKYLAVGLLVISLLAAYFFSFKAAFNERSIQIAVLILLTALFIYIISISPWIYEVLQKTQKLISEGRSIAYPKNKLELYDSCAKVLSSETPAKIRHAILHVHDAKENVPDKLNKNGYYKAFDTAMRKCIETSGTTSSEIQTLFLITSIHRLNYVESFLNDNFSKAQNFKVKVYIAHNLLPYLSPLIIGESNAFLGLEDRTNYRVNSELHVTGKDSVKIMIEYFDSLWQSENAIMIRSATRLDYEKIEEIKKKI